MKSYELSEFTFLLKLGLWSGGAVSGLGHVSAASNHHGEMPVAGMAGVWLGGGVMLESMDGERLVFSVYDPYAGRYRCFDVSAELDTPEEAGERVTMAMIEKSLTGILEDEIKNVRRGKHPTVSDYTPWRDKRRYEATNYSFRTGSIPKPGRRR